MRLSHDSNQHSSANPTANSVKNYLRYIFEVNGRWAGFQERHVRRRQTLNSDASFVPIIDHNDDGHSTMASTQINISYMDNGLRCLPDVVQKLLNGYSL